MHTPKPGLLIVLTVVALAGSSAAQSRAPRPETRWLGGWGNWHLRDQWDNGAPDESSNALIDDGEAMVWTGEARAWEVPVGDQGAGELQVAYGASLSSKEVCIGKTPSGRGVASVIGAGSEWDTFWVLTWYRSMYVGYEGNGTFQIADGGAVTTGGFTLGSRAGSRGYAAVTGTDSVLNAAGVRSGGDGIGQLDVLDGGNVITQKISIGRSGSLIVDGTGSSIQSLGDDGNPCAGLLEVRNGGHAYFAGVLEGGDLRVDGAGSSLLSDSSMIVGKTSPGQSVTITNGGQATFTGESNNLIGLDESAMVIVSGEGSSLTLHSWLSVGYGSAGALYVQDGGMLSSLDFAHVGAGWAGGCA